MCDVWIQVSSGNVLLFIGKNEEVNGESVHQLVANDGIEHKGHGEQLDIEDDRVTDDKSNKSEALYSNDEEGDVTNNRG